MDEDGEIIPIIADGEDMEMDDSQVPDELPVLSLRNNVLFPGVVLPISIGRTKSIKLIRDAYEGDRIVGAVAQIDPEIEDPKFSDLHKIGTIGYIIKLLEMPDGSTTAIIQGKKRIELTLANQKRLEVARALATGPELLLLDELMAGLNPTEVAQAMELVNLIREKGITIIMIEHVMKAIMNVCERIMVLHHGEKIAQGTPQEIATSETVIKVYLGDKAHAAG